MFQIFVQVPMSILFYLSDLRKITFFDEISNNYTACTYHDINPPKVEIFHGLLLIAFEKDFTFILSIKQAPGCHQRMA